MLGGPRHGPRPIDVDLLLLGDVEHATERLTLPHPQVTRGASCSCRCSSSTSTCHARRHASREALDRLGEGEQVERVGAL